MSFLSGLGGAAASLAGGILNNYYNRKAQSAQNDWQLGMWQLNNDYNSPQSVMSRLEEAGLNPNLVYGNGGASYQATMPTAAKRAPADFNLGLNPVAFQQLENMETQNELLKAQEDNVFWQAGLNQNNANIANSNANIAKYKEAYAKKEYEVFKKTGIIPESYRQSHIEGEIVNFLRNGLQNLLLQ